MNLPNKLTVLRVFMIPLFLVVLLTQWIPMPWREYAAVAIFALASLTDWFDGRLARKYDLVTNFGRFMDPLADKLLVCSALIALVEMERLSAWVVIILVSREFIVTGFRLLAVEQGIVIAAGIWGKFKTATQMLMIMSVIISGGPLFARVLDDGLILLSVALSIVSAVEYVYTNRAVLSDLH